MAKRKRLTPALMAPNMAAPETKSMRPPIADVAHEAATVGALMELSDSINAARKEGRWIERLPLTAIIDDYLVRDRIVADADDMTALKDSLRKTGQQTAIEVVAQGEGKYGLISGWRRVSALRELSLNGGLDTVLAIVRRPDDAAASYLAMVEENEIRSGLSFYERARVIARAKDEGTYASDKDALAALFHAVPRAKRSKIGSFVRIVRALDDVLLFPVDLSEKSGLALAQALLTDAGLVAKLRKAISGTPPKTASEELALITAALRGPAVRRSKPVVTPLQDGLSYVLEADGSLRIQGAALRDEAFRERLIAALRGMT